MKLTDQQKWEYLACIPHVEKRFMHTKRTQDISLSLGGIELATKTRIFTRNKLTNELFSITPMGNQYISTITIQ